MNKALFIFISLIFSTSQIWANSNARDYATSSEDEEIRVNPMLEIDTISELKSHPDYPFINLSKNIITYNGANWESFYKKLSNSNNNKISILHIGDSHLQADIATGKTRMLMQEKFGNAGRGIIIPFKLAKTNQPIDYSFNCSCNYTYSSLMKRPWRTSMRLTGVSFSPTSEKFNISINTSNRKTPNQHFYTLRIHVEGDLYVDDVITNNKSLIYEEDFIIEESQSDHTDIIFKEPQTSVQLSLSSIGKLTVFGVSLLNNSNGVIYNVIGNNGATYETYNRMGNMGQDCSIFNPDLIIVSLGTNEAFGTISDDAFYNTIANFVNDMKRFNPNTPILLVTPMECQRKGRINTNIKRLRDVIIRYGFNNNIAIYDWYEVAGGDGASSKWGTNQLMGGDRIHNTSKGYYLQGTLLYEALIHDLNL